MGPSMTDVSRSMRQQMEENDHSKRKTKQVFFEDMSLLTIGGEIANNISICFCTDDIVVVCILSASWKN